MADLVENQDQFLLQVLHHVVVESRREMEGWVTDICDEEDHVRDLQNPPQLPPGLRERERERGGGGGGRKKER